MAMTAPTPRRQKSKREEQAAPPLRIVRTKQRPQPENPALAYAQCRALGHSWQHRGPVSEGEGDVRVPSSMQFGSIGYRSVCDFCTTERIKWVTRSGNLGPTTYRYVDGYQTRGDDAMRPMQWRKTWVVTIFGDG